MTPRAQVGTATASADEAGLWRAVQAGSQAAREQLFDAYASFARRIAGRHMRDRTRGDLDLQELRQLAYAGLLEAIDRFDPDRGVPFRGYAARRIAGSVLDGIARDSEVREQVAFRSRLRSERIRSLARQEAAAASSEDALRALADLATGLALGFMLESGLAASEETADRSPSAYEGLAWKETVQRLHAALEDLPERERLVVRHHYLEGVAFEQIAERLGLSKGRVSQIHRDAIARLRKRMAARPEFVLER